MTDILVRNEGTILLIRPVTAAAREWIAENVATDAHARIGDGFVADHRPGWAILEGAHDAGLVLEEVA